MCFSLAWLTVVMPDIRNYNCASNYILMFGKLFHVYKLIHIDLQPKILMASFLLASLVNNDLMFMSFFCFIAFVFFKKEKKRACCILMFFSTELLCEMKLQITAWFWCSKQNIFWKSFYDNAIKIFLWSPKYCSDLNSWSWIFLY